MGATFDDLERPLAIGCTDLATGALAIVREGSVAEAVRASCALPIYFAPVQRNGKVLIDGGFIEPVPFRTLSAFDPEVSLGVHAGINADRATLIQGTLRLHRSWVGRSFQWLVRHVPLRLALGRLIRGIAVAARSYEKPGDCTTWCPPAPGPAADSLVGFPQVPDRHRHG